MRSLILYNSTGLIVNFKTMVKNNSTSSEPGEFEQHLAKQQQRYELLLPLGGDHCHLRFSGPYQGKLVIWDAYLQTLAYYVRNRAPADPLARQFIEVGDEGPQGRLIRIGLNLPKIDEPVVLKTLIMVRQYKRLALGRHEFGEWVQFPK
jgi:hypothetical protein